jgi:hypothetical protein
MRIDLKAWRHQFGLTQRQTGWLLDLPLSAVRRLDAGTGELGPDDAVWLQAYAACRDRASDSVEVRVGRWTYRVNQAAGTLRPANAAAARVLRKRPGRRAYGRSTVEFALALDYEQPGIGWLWLHADGRPARRNPALPPCWRVVRPADPTSWKGWSTPDPAA